MPQVTSLPLHARLDTRLPGAAEATPGLALASQWDQAVFTFGVFIAPQGVHADLASVHHDREREIVVACLAGLLPGRPDADDPIARRAGGDLEVRVRVLCLVWVLRERDIHVEGQ